jgi:hypothetical protein
MGAPVFYGACCLPVFGLSSGLTRVRPAIASTPQILERDEASVKTKPECSGVALQHINLRNLPHSIVAVVVAVIERVL